jgi:hypothetical protein
MTQRGKELEGSHDKSQRSINVANDYISRLNEELREFKEEHKFLT